MQSKQSNMQKKHSKRNILTYPDDYFCNVHENRSSVSVTCLFQFEFDKKPRKHKYKIKYAIDRLDMYYVLLGGVRGGILYFKSGRNFEKQRDAP